MLYAALAINLIFLIAGIIIVINLSRQNWLKTGTAKLNGRLAGQQDLPTLAHNILTFLCRYLKVQVGGFYFLQMPDENTHQARLHRLASYAYPDAQPTVPPAFALGEGLIGQAALEKQLIVVNHIPADYLKIRSGLGEGLPRHLLIIPFLYEEKVYGVLELATVRRFKKFEVKFLQQLMPRIGLAVNAADAQQKLQSLLQQTQAYSKALQDQQEAVLAREERIRAIVDTVVDGIVTINDKGIIHSFNKAAERIFAYQAEEVIGQNVSMLMPNPYRDAHNQYLHNYIHTGVAKIIGNPREVQAQRKDGQTFPIDLAVAEMQVMGERMFTGIVRDITERKASEEAIHEQQERLQTSNEELQMQQEEMQATNEELQAQEEELRQINEELVNRTRQLEEQKASIYEKNIALKETHHILEVKATELEQANRYKSEFLANMSHELRTPLNSLLILAQLLAENKQGNLDTKQIEYARTIHNAGTELLDLINDILDLSKVEAGKIEINLEWVNLGQLIEEITTKFHYICDNKGLRLNIEVVPGPASTVYSDPQRIKQILNNLLANAVKFTEKGSVTLTIQPPTPEDRVLAQLDLAPETVLIFSVIDTGIGIPPDKQTVIFEAFQQADGTTSRRFGGTGLGLSISRQLARLLGGEIHLYSEADKGSVFSLYIPVTSPEVVEDKLVAEVDKPNTIPAPSPPPPLSTEPRPVVNSTINPAIAEQQASNVPVTPFEDDRNQLTADDNAILVIEDDPRFCRILYDLTHQRGFKCLCTSEGHTGIALAIQYRPKAIILDMGLPKIDGLTLLEMLKENSITRHIPVHCMSASLHNRDAVKKLGAIGYLLKPISMQELAAALQDLTLFINKKLRCLLILADDPQNQQNITELVDNQGVELLFATDKQSALNTLEDHTFDCVIVDINVMHGKGISLLAQLHHEADLSAVPVIVYAERPLSASEEDLLNQCEQELTIKHVHSPEHLLDEATLFLHQVEAHLSPEKQQILRKLHDKEALLAHKKILIVDDDPRNSFALMTMLEEKDMEVFTADNGKEALSLLEEHYDMDLVLMDVMMPEMDGYEAMQAIRRQSHFRRLPIIALTAKAMKGDKAKCIEAGANDYLPKPIEMDKLISLMRVWLY